MIRRRGGAVERTRFESGRPYGARGFKSHRLRHKVLNRQDKTTMEAEGWNMKKVTKEELDARVAEMKARGLTGEAPRSLRPKINVRELVAKL